MIKRTIAVLCALALLAALPLSAADKWTVVHSQNFTLVGNAPEGTIRRTARDLELFRLAFSRLFNVPKSSVGTTIVVFRSDSAFKPYKPLYKGKPVDVAGYFQPGEDANYIALSAEDMGDPSAIYHEFVHAMMSDSTGDLPAWFNEGIAEFYRTFEPIGNGKTFLLGTPIGEHVDVLKANRFIPLDQLFQINEGSPNYNEDDKAGIFYAESWALVHYLMLGENQKFKDLIFPLIASLESGTSAVKSFEDVFHTDIAAFQKAFEAYVEQRQAFPAIRYSTTATLDPEKDMTARVISEAESEFYMGDLLAHMQRYAEAEPHLKKSIQLDPKLSVAQSAMGRLLADEHRNADAMPYLKRGVELDPMNYLAHYYYADGIWNATPETAVTAEERAIVRSELLQTVELAPQFVRAAEILARVNLVEGENFRETLQVLRKARQQFPGKDRLVLDTAYALSRTNERDDVPNLLEQLIARPLTASDVKQDARSLLDFMNKQSAQRRETIGPRAAGAASVRGMLMRVDCTGGWTLSVRIGENTASFHAATPSAVQLETHTKTVKSMPCGSVPDPGAPVIITYAKQPDSTMDPLMIEFFPQE